MLFLAIDPGSVKVGMAVFEDAKLLYYCFHDFEKTSYERRPAALYDALEEIARNYRLDEVAIEAATRRQSDSGFIVSIPELEVAVGVIKRWAKARKLGYRAYNSATWRAGFSGSGTAKKDETARVVYLTWPRLPRNLPDHVTDAIGIGAFHDGRRRFEEVTRG